jgi:hypothetical protein
VQEAEGPQPEGQSDAEGDGDIDGAGSERHADQFGRVDEQPDAADDTARPRPS